MAGIASLFWHVLFPVACPICGRAGSTGCLGCIKGVLSPSGPVCIECLNCYPCDRHTLAFPHYFGAAHKGPARQLIHLLKYGHHGALGISMGRALAACLSFPLPDALVPIPLHNESPRFFNQSEKIAQGLSLELGVPVMNCLSWNVRIHPRALTKSYARSKLPEGAFKLDECKLKADIRTVMICDDVCTTGATILGAAETLAEGGLQVLGSASFTLAKGKK